MKKLLLIGVLVTLAFVATGCSQSVPPGYVGKIVGTEGVQPELYGVGRHTVTGRDRMVLIETASVLRPAPLSVIMADRYVDEAGNEQVRPGAKMQFQLNVRYRVNPDDKVISAALKDMKLSKGVDSISAVDFYKKYGAVAVGKVGREVLGAYTPREVMKNLNAINATLLSKLNDELAGTPLILSQAALGPFSLPNAIQSQIDENLRTEESKVKKQAEQEIAMLEKQNDKALADEQAAIDDTTARSMANQNEILSASITDGVLELRRLEIRKMEIQMMEKALSNGKNNSVFIPYGAVNNPGAQMRMFQK